MKKTAIIFSLALLASSCGPKRYGCGPRCEIESKQNKIQIKKDAQKTQYAVASTKEKNKYE